MRWARARMSCNRMWVNAAQAAVNATTRAKATLRRRPMRQWLRKFIVFVSAKGPTVAPGSRSLGVDCGQACAARTREKSPLDSAFQPLRHVLPDLEVAADGR